MQESFILIAGFLVGILLFLSLIVIHELGHFIIAKLCKAYVYEFSIGFGPRLFSIKGKETWFSMRLFPFGGYCSIATTKADPPLGRDDEAVPDERKMDYIKRWKKLIFIIFGPLMNLFLALIIFTLTFAITQSKPNAANWVGANFDKDLIAWQLLDDSNSGINSDEIYIIWGWKINDGHEIVFNNIDGDDPLSQQFVINEIAAPTAADFLTTATTFNQSIPVVINFLQTNNDDFNINDLTIAFAYKIANKFTGLSDWENAEWTNFSNPIYFTLGDRIGISAPTRFFKNSTVAYGHGWIETFRQSLSFLRSFGMIFTGQFSNLAGPVGIAGQTASVFNDAQQFFLYVGMLSANLFILNMIFLPPLDGYKFIEILIEIIIRRDLPTKYKIIVYSIGAILFLSLFIGITIIDFLR